MPIPDYETIMLPFLKFLGDKKEHPLNDALEHIYKAFNLTEREKKELLPSGTDLIINNRIRWAILYLKKAGLLESTKKGSYRITEKGFKILQEKPPKIDVKYLMRFPEFVRFKAPREEKKIPVAQKKITDSLNPMELLEDAHQKIKAELADDLLREIKTSSPRFFEAVIVGLLVKMGYGGSRKDAGQAIGQSGDQGIDGIIKEDKLGLDTIYLQAKRWEGTVGRPEIQKFVGALKGQGAGKGIFITTSTFSNDAIDYASKIDSPKIVLIDGEKLAELMIENNIGVSSIATYEVKKIDTDFFSEE
jgi:restriction system protein